MSDFFDEHYRQYEAWFEKNRFVYLSELEAVRSALPPKGKGLEVGVGSGRFAGPLGITAGIDPSEKMVELARERGIDAALGTGEELSFKDSTFDYVAIIVTLCFVRDPEKVLEESARVLKPGGRIIIGIIDKDSFLGRFYQQKKSIFYGRARFFGIEEVTRMLESAGFGGFSYHQTIFYYPDRFSAVEKPQEGYGRGGFVVVGAVKKQR